MNPSLSTSRMIAWTVWIIASVFYAYQYILRVMPNIMLDDIMQQFDMSAAAFGQFSGIYYIGYSLLHLPVGIMLDRFGPRKVMSGCILLTVLGTLPLLFATHWLYPIIGRLFVGIGSSAAILGLFKIIRMTFSEERFPRMLSFSVMIGLIGAIYGGGPVRFMLDNIGYEAVLQLFALSGVVLAAATYWIVPENVESKEQTTVSSNLVQVLTNYRVLLCCFFAGLMVGPMEGFADVWSAAFLKQVYGYDGGASASLPSMIYIGMCFGAPVLSMIAEKINNYLATIIGAGIVMTVGFALLLASHLSVSAMTISFIVIGVCSAYQILAIYKASTYVSDNVAGLTTAVANMIIMLFGYAFHTTMGGIINAMGGPNSPEALAYGVAVIPVALCIGSIGFVLLYLTEKQPEKAAAPSEPLASLD